MPSSSTSFVTASLWRPVTTALLLAVFLSLTTAWLPSVRSSDISVTQPAAEIARNLINHHQIARLGPADDRCINNDGELWLQDFTCDPYWTVETAITKFSLSRRLYVHAGNTRWLAIESGWPIRFAHCIGVRTEPSQSYVWAFGAFPHKGTLAESIDMPIAPLPYAFRPGQTALNVTTWATPIAALFIVRRALIANHRASRGRCVFCSYPVGAGNQCSECGRLHIVR